jgi:hypothetical protein
MEHWGFRDKVRGAGEAAHGLLADSTVDDAGGIPGGSG